jgi:hypothetical protein
LRLEAQRQLTLGLQIRRDDLAQSLGGCVRLPQCAQADDQTGNWSYSSHRVLF